jgi:hypothetical protein
MPFKNTGEQEVEQVDTNESSPTFGEKRWVVSGINTTACPLPAPVVGEFKSKLILRTVYRDDCESPETPVGVSYRIEQGFRVSLISQADADAKAEAYFEDNQQTFANANDTCSSDTVEEQYTCEHDVNGCWTGYIVYTSTGERVEYTSGEQYNKCRVASVDGLPCPE